LPVGTEESHEKPQDLNPGPPDYIAGVLTTNHSVWSEAVAKKFAKKTISFVGIVINYFQHLFKFCVGGNENKRNIS
jgi:hypothetical protein